VIPYVKSKVSLGSLLAVIEAATKAKNPATASWTGR
jgi:hypothetical protein